MGIPAVSGDDAIRAIVTRNNRAATAEHRPPLQRPFGNVDALSESDIRAVEGAYGYELARPPSAGLMPMAAVFLAQAREAESRGGGDIMTVLRGFQRTERRSTTHCSPRSPTARPGRANRRGTTCAATRRAAITPEPHPRLRGSLADRPMPRADRGRSSRR